MIQVCLLGEKYLDQVAALEKICFPDDPWSRTAFENELTNSNAHFLVATDEETGMMIGYGGVWLMYDVGDITNIAVHPDYRREGIGAKLLSLLEQICMEHAMKAITLEVRESNYAAQCLYRSRGYLTCGLRKRYYQGKEDALIMTKEFRTEEKQGEEL